MSGKRNTIADDYYRDNESIWFSRRVIADANLLHQSLHSAQSETSNPYVTTTGHDSLFMEETKGTNPFVWNPPDKWFLSPSSRYHCLFHILSALSSFVCILLCSGEVCPICYHLSRLKRMIVTHRYCMSLKTTRTLWVPVRVWTFSFVSNLRRIRFGY